MTGVVRATVAEALGTALLLAIIVGSGIMGERLSAANAALTLLANSLATGFGLAALIVVFAPVSGAHFNPLVTLVAAARGELPRASVSAYLAAHFTGAIIGVIAAHAMFGEPLLAFGTRVRDGPAQWWSEFVATFGLLLVVLGCARRGAAVTGAAVGAYIAAAYWFTGSTSFANPAVTLARALTPTFSGIRPVDVVPFALAQAAGAVAAAIFWRWLERNGDDLAA